MTPPGSFCHARCRRRPALSHGLRILVVDDDASVREVVASLLEHAGYGVVTCVSADDALSLLAAQGRAFSLVITDVQMPGSLDGLELARRLADRMPDMAVIVLTASQEVLESGRAIPSVVAVVDKSETNRVLLGHVRAILGA